MIRCLAVDDETPALDILEDNISRVPFLHLEKRCKNIYEAMEALKTLAIDLMFLDVQMPGMNGIDFLRNLPGRPMVIFITAHKKYALDGFDLDVLDYLVKPVSFDRFIRAAGKALEYQQSRVKETPPTQTLTPSYFFVNTEYRLVKIFTHEITHIEALKNYVKIHLTGGARPILCRSSLKSFEEKGPDKTWVRVHKSFIVSIDKISSIERDTVMIGPVSIPVSKSFRAEFFRRIETGNIK